MPNCWVDWPAPVPNAAMLFKVMDALPTPQKVRDLLDQGGKAGSRLSLIDWCHAFFVCC